MAIAESLFIDVLNDSLAFVIFNVFSPPELVASLMSSFPSHLHFAGGDADVDDEEEIELKLDAEELEFIMLISESSELLIFVCAFDCWVNELCEAEPEPPDGDGERLDIFLLLFCLLIACLVV